MRMILLVLASLLFAPTALAPSRDPDFGAWWHDDRAELDGYRLTVQRYGHPRVGRAAMIVVTEPFSDSKHVKLDDPSRAKLDVLPVIKMNLVRSFQTGIYDYATNLSLFVREDDLAPVKEAFSSSEWCGQVYEESDFRRGQMSDRVASYFEGESGSSSHEVPRDGVIEDQLFLLLRGLRGTWLPAGTKRAMPFLASPFWRRLAHQRLDWAMATIEHLAEPATVKVPAGAFACDVYVVRTPDGRSGRFDVERAYPRRIVRWQWTPPANGAPLGGTDAGELTGSTRAPYWKEHDPGAERELPKLGLVPAVR